MTDLVAPSDAIRRFGDSVAQMATAVTAAAGADQAPSIAAGASVFGAIGQDFLEAFATAQANHTASANELARVYTKTSSTSYESAAAYEAADGASAAGFTSNGLQA